MSRHETVRPPPQQYVVKYSLKKYHSCHYTELTARSASEAVSRIVENLGVSWEEIDDVFESKGRGWIDDHIRERASGQR